MSKLINTVPKRIGIAVLLGALIHLIVASTADVFVFDTLEMVMYAAIAYIVVTILNAVLSTFFTDEEEGT